MSGGMGGGMGFGGGWAAALAPTPELMAQIERLPPADDEPRVDLERERAYDRTFLLRRFLRPFRWAIAVSLGLVVADTVLSLAGPVLIRSGIDTGVEHHRAGVLFVASLIFLAAVLIDWADSFALTRYTGRTAQRMLLALRVRIFAHLQRLGLDYYEREMAGRVMTRMTTDVEALSQLLQNGLVNALVAVLSFLGVATVLLVMDWQLALVALSVLPALGLATLWYRDRSRRAYARARDRIAAVNANFQESVSGIRVAQAYRREDRNIRAFRGLSGEYRGARLDAQRLLALYFPFVSFLSDVGAALVLGVGAALTRGGTLAPGLVIAFLLYLDQLFSPIGQLSQTFSQWQQAGASMDKIRELMAIEPSTPVADDPVVPSGRLRGEIRFVGASFRYRGAPRPALEELDLTIAPGETVAIVGPTGAGKSTLVKLVARFHDPTAGRVEVDGVPLDRYDLEAYRHQLGYVPQEPFLFAGTVADNIAYGRPDATRAEIEAAARAVGADVPIRALPGGYDHVISERGKSLSAGQKQLLCLARALLVDPAILILDEATASLDLATEARVSRAMGVASRGRTTLLIAHRLPSARLADRIVVLRDGRVAEIGTHAQLLAAGGWYAAAWESFAPTELAS
jgi:ATP-binding cassette subfamily B protein